MKILTGASVDLTRRGLGIPEGQRVVATRLRNQALALARQYELAKYSAKILDTMLVEGPDGVAAATENTWTALPFVAIRMQLFRMLVVDIYALVLDDHKRSGSVRALLRELRRDSTGLDALRAHYSDPSALDVLFPRFHDLTPVEVEQAKAETLARVSKSIGDRFDQDWSDIDAAAAILNTDAARRMSWARVTAIAHLQPGGPQGLVALDDEPPFGSGKLTWREPIEFLTSVDPLVGDLICLITTNIGTLRYGTGYIQAFWNRFKTGDVDVVPAHHGDSDLRSAATGSLGKLPQRNS